jgi:hypothetical protein
MTSTEKNIVRAKQIVGSWPEWKQNIQLTKYTPSNKEKSKKPAPQETQYQCG